jgi:hypothetical protein
MSKGPEGHFEPGGSAGISKEQIANGKMSGHERAASMAAEVTARARPRPRAGGTT